MVCVSVPSVAATRTLAVLLLGVFLVVGAGAPELPRKYRSGTVATPVLNVRARPGLTYEVIAKFKQGDKLQVYGAKGEWLEVGVPPQVEAWMVARFLEADGTINAERVRIHSGPGILFSHFGLGRKGEKVQRIGEVSADGWQKIVPPAGTTAWVNEKFVTLEDPLSEGRSALPVQGDARGTGGGVGAAVPAGASAAPPVAVGEQTRRTETAAVAVAGTVDQPVEVVSPTETAVGGTVETPVVAAPAAAVESGSTAVAESPVRSADDARPAPVSGGATATVPATIGESVMREGTLTSLKSQGSRACTHLLSVRMEDTLYPVCFLVSSKVSLEEWEGQKVRVHGREIWYPGWKRPVIGVMRVQRLTP